LTRRRSAGAMSDGGQLSRRSRAGPAGIMRRKSGVWGFMSVRAPISTEANRLHSANTGHWANRREGLRRVVSGLLATTVAPRPAVPPDRGRTSRRLVRHQCAPVDAAGQRSRGGRDVCRDNPPEPPAYRGCCSPSPLFMPLPPGGKGLRPSRCQTNSLPFWTVSCPTRTGAAA
jgi:hypothetical protein